jgi:hypothetical protein
MRSLAVALTLALVAVPALAQDEDVLRPCRRADLIGLWGVVRFGFATDARVDRDDPAYRPHQRYVFNANATMIYTASDVPPTLEEHRALLRLPTRDTWALDASGHLLRQSSGAARPDRSDCRVITRPVRDPRSPVPTLVGDVLLTERGADERPITRRLLRKLGGDE